jgi:hypothetical protein
VHETHNQFAKLPRLAPAELSRLKAEKDLKTTQDLAMARKIQDEQIRQNILLREQTQRAAAGLPVRPVRFAKYHVHSFFSLFNPKHSSSRWDRKLRLLNLLSNLKRNSSLINNLRNYNSSKPNNNSARIKTNVQVSLLQPSLIVLLDWQELQTPDPSIVNRPKFCNRRGRCKHPCNCKRVDKRTWSVLIILAFVGI